MDTAVSLRDKLRQYIDVADEQKLQAIYVLLADEIDWSYTSDEITMLYERRENYLKGVGKSYTIEESLKAIRRQKR